MICESVQQSDPFSLCKSQLQTLVSLFYSVHFFIAKVEQLSVTSENAIIFTCITMLHMDSCGYIWSFQHNSVRVQVGLILSSDGINGKVMV